jgi:glucan phosphoethanolaminetransferase (alkaline phosphatase superfamily)
VSKFKFKKGCKQTLYFFKGSAFACMTGTAGMISFGFALLAPFLAITYVGYPLALLCLLISSASGVVALSSKVEMEDAFIKAFYK